MSACTTVQNLDTVNYTQLCMCSHESVECGHRIIQYVIFTSYIYSAHTCSLTVTAKSMASGTVWVPCSS